MHEDFEAPYCSVGELWGYQDRVAFICGNTIQDDGTMWVMDWNSGDVAYAPVDQLIEIEDRRSLSEMEVVSRFSSWAKEGRPDAMWWLAWWFEGTNHPKSVWYYVAAMRASPQTYSWAQDRISGDARYASMCEGVAEPDLAFLGEIPEMNGCGIGRDWQEAISRAEKAEHVLAKEPLQDDRNVFRQKYHIPSCDRSDKS